MNKSTKTMIAGAALMGMFSGAFAQHASASVSSANTTVSAGQLATSLDDSTTGKHDCKAKNDCKGQGGCKTGNNGCKAKNDCKGKGGCATNK